MIKKTKILIVENKRADVELIEYELKKGAIDFVAEVVQTEQAYGESLKTFAPDIILSDYSLPSFDGDTAFRKREEAAPHIPFIFVSGTIGEENSIEYLKKGVTDYVLKDRLFTLSSKVIRALKESEEKQQKNRIERERMISEKRLMRAQQVAHLGYWETDLTDLSVIWSNEVYNIFEITQANIKPSHSDFLTFVHPEDRLKVDKAFADSIDKHTTRNSIEHRVISGSGLVKVIEERWEISYNEQGKPVLAEGTCQDITQRKKIDEKLEFDRNNLKALINNTDDLMWSVDRNFKLITSNHAFDKMVREMFGESVLKGDDLLGRNQLQHFKPYYERAFSGEKFTEIEHTDFPDDRWSEISFYPIYKEEQVIGTACFSRNITEGRKTERHLRLLESVITHTNDAVLITEAEPIDELGPRIIFVNKAFTEMTGYKPDEVIGKTPRLLQGSKSDRLQLDALQEAIRTRQSIEVEIINYKKNGDEFWNNFSIVPVTDVDGRLNHFVSIQRDATSRRLLEEITRMRLERKVEERTKELNEALRKEKDLVKLKNNFISVASHEFRTPLSTISLATGFVRKYQQKMKPVEIDAKLENIEKQVSHMSYLLDDVLLVGKTSAGKMELKLSEVSIDFFEKLAREVINSIGAKHSLQILTECASRVVVTDEKLIHAIITNLLTNAVKFSPDASEIVMTIKCSKKNLLITVKDFGIGIPPADLKVLFISFSRGSNVGAIEGTGLGLSIVRNACTFLKGKVDVQSEVGKGTEFTITLPLKYV